MSKILQLFVFLLYHQSSHIIQRICFCSFFNILETLCQAVELALTIHNNFISIGAGIIKMMYSTFSFCSPLTVSNSNTVIAIKKNRVVSFLEGKGVWQLVSIPRGRGYHSITLILLYATSVTYCVSA